MSHHVHGKGQKEHSFDAIVVGSGISGGWAAKELTEKGLRVLVLERGRHVEHIGNYPTTNSAPWQIRHLGRPSQETLRRQHVQHRTGYATNPAWNHFFVDDLKHPYIEEKRFDWMRGYQTGGRSLVWGRHSYRLSPVDFEANAREGIAIPWPIRYEELAPWYDYVETFAGISGSKEGLEILPDGQFQPPMPLTPIELDFKSAVETKWNSRHVIPARVAHLTQPTKEQLELGRGPCMYRNFCMRGCPFGAYFSSQSATLKAAARTGKLTLRNHAIVHSLIWDAKVGKVTGVHVVDENSKEHTEFFAKVIFLCASAVPSTAILMNTKTRDYPNGLDESGALGRYLMDHHLGVGAGGYVEAHSDKVHFGRRPGGFYIPRFRNYKEPAKANYLRGFGYQGDGLRQGWNRWVEGFGKAFKEQITSFGPWTINMMGFGEVLPYHDNRIYLHPELKDEWGLPMVVADAELKENEHNMRRDIEADALEMMEALGVKGLYSYVNEVYIGIGIHEMGTARMSATKETGVLNKYNQLWASPNVFCSDGAAMVSAGCQNPSLTYMAMSARAANHAVEELRKGHL